MDNKTLHIFNTIQSPSSKMFRVCSKRKNSEIVSLLKRKRGEKFPISREHHKLDKSYKK